MTRYQGGKKHIGKELHNIMIEFERISGLKDLDYFEPFAGMGGVMRHFGNDVREGNSSRYIFATDINNDIVLMWKALQQGWKPPDKCTEKLYNQLKYSTISSPERGFIGCACSFGGTYFSGYSKKYKSKGTKRDDLKNGIKAITNILPDIKPVNFIDSSSYESFDPEGFMIYCDPPYENTKQYSFGKFDSKKFWETVRHWSKRNIVFISEESAPKDFISIWEKKCNRSIIHNSGHEKKAVEKLFVHDSLIKSF